MKRRTWCIQNCVLPIIEPTAGQPLPETTRSSDGDDRAVLERIAAGDKAALASLYREYHRRLVRFLIRFTRREDVIEEVVNDTFLIVWQKAHEFRAQARVSTWIMGIAYRVTLKALRQGELPMEPLQVQHENVAGASHYDHELADWIHKGLTRLSPEQRLVMEMAYVMGHSLDEIAEMTGSAVSTVKARMFHARVKLRNVMPALAGFAEVDL